MPQVPPTARHRSASPARQEAARAPAQAGGAAAHQPQGGGNTPGDDTTEIPRPSSAPPRLQRSRSSQGYLHPPLLTRVVGTRPSTPTLPDALPVPSPPASPEREQMSQGTLERRMERLVDGRVYGQDLGLALSHQTLSLVRLEIVERLTALSAMEAAALCDAATQFCGPGASVMARSLSLLFVLQHRIEKAANYDDDPMALANRVRSISLQDRHLQQSLNPRDAFFHMLKVHQGPHEDSSGMAALTQGLVIHRIDPPVSYWPMWIERSRDDFLDLASEASDQATHFMRLVVSSFVAEDASPWVVANLASAALWIRSHAPLPAQVTAQQAAQELHEWNAYMLPELTAEDTAPALFTVASLAPDVREEAWRAALKLQLRYPEVLITDLIDLVSDVPPTIAKRFDKVLVTIVPSWAAPDEVVRMLCIVRDQVHNLDNQTLQRYHRYCAPEMTVPQRIDLLETLVAWRANARNEGLNKAHHAAHAWLTAKAVPRVLVASTLLLFSRVRGHQENVEPALQFILKSNLDLHRQGQAIDMLAARKDEDPMALAVAFTRAASGPRIEDPESSMQVGRLRASDYIIGQVMARVPVTHLWHQTLHQIIAHIHATKLDPAADPLLLDASRTGVSELDNALNVLMGPTRSGDATQALVADPVYALTGTQTAVGLGYLAASLWQLLRESPAQAATPEETAAQRRHVRTDFILALARSVETDGHRVCGWGLSERLTEACAGYIDGIEQLQILYPTQLLTELAQQFAAHEGRQYRPVQESFFHRAQAQAEELLQSPEAIRAFNTQLLEVMRLEYDWPSQNV